MIRIDRKVSIFDLFPGKVAFRLAVWDEIYTLKDLLGKSKEDLLSIQGFGPKRLKIIEDTLRLIGCQLKNNKEKPDILPRKEVER